MTLQPAPFSETIQRRPANTKRIERAMPQEKRESRIARFPRAWVSAARGDGSATIEQSPITEMSSILIAIPSYIAQEGPVISEIMNHHRLNPYECTVKTSRFSIGICGGRACIGRSSPLKHSPPTTTSISGSFSNTALPANSLATFQSVSLSPVCRQSCPSQESCHRSREVRF